MDRGERRRASIQEGQRAAAVEAAIGEMVATQVDNIIARIIQTYRGGNATDRFLLGAAGELAALDKLMSTLDSAQRKASAAAEQEYGTEA